MAEEINLLDPDKLKRNPENPRLVFHQEELDALQRSIKEQGILVPLTVYRDGKQHYLLDGERRWRSAIKLGLNRVPVIVQPKPDRLQNLMMMFAIHNARKDWDPLPTALKMRQIEIEFTKRNKRAPREAELAGLASISRGEVRRLKKLLGLPEEYRHELLAELKKPRAQQMITVDHVLETTRGAESLRKRDVIDEETENDLRRAILNKFRKGIVKNTVAPRKLAKIARGVERGQVSKRTARAVVRKLIHKTSYSIDQAFEQSVEKADFEHGINQLVERVQTGLADYEHRGYEVSSNLHDALSRLRDAIDSLLRK